jgi:UPF0176 protein
MQYQEHSYTILLYYKYVNIDDVDALYEAQKEICEHLGLTGRIIVSKEGINGTVEGISSNAYAYVEYMRSLDEFKDIHFKYSQGTGDAFPKLSIKIRSELVSAHLGDDDINPTQVTGKHLDPEELHKWFEQDKEFYIVDMRNDYEFKVGYFENSLLPSLTNFRDLPKILPELEHLKNKTVLTVCTGGVRCEKASGFLVSKGFKDVYQLNGGIVSYMEKYPNQHFLGKLYVFDGRITMGFNVDAPEHRIVSKCELCGEPSDTYVDCNYLHCDGKRHFIACENCKDEHGHIFCSDECKALAYVEAKFI